MRIAVFGAGTVGALRCATVRDNAETELVGIADVDLAKAGAAAAGTNALVTASYHDLLSKVSPDAVIISSPVQYHEEMCLAAIEAGCHVLCEKPLSNTVASCRRILAAAQEKSLRLAVGFNHRYYPSVQFLTKCIDDGLIGKVDHLRVFGGHDGLHNFRQEWMYKSAISGGGAMMDVGIHMTDLVNFIASDVVEVTAIATNQIWGIEGSEDNAMVIMRTVRDIPVIYQATWNEWKGYQIFLEAYGDKGMVRAAYAPMYNLLITQDKPGAPRKRQHKRYPEIILREKLQGWESTTQRAFAEELVDFIRMGKGQPLRLANGEAGCRAVEIANAVYCSSREHRTVILSQL